MRNTAVSVLAHYRRQHADAKRALDQMVDDCRATKTTPPNNYWEREHAARKKMFMCEEIAKIVQEEIDERKI